MMQADLHRFFTGRGQLFHVLQKKRHFQNGAEYAATLFACCEQKLDVLVK
jgi:hypothetical protein